jgi:hypothetical protein
VWAILSIVADVLTRALCCAGRWAVRRNVIKGIGATMRWQVKLSGLTWDDGKGEYDVSDLPKEWTTIVLADDEADAVDYALIDASDCCGSLIEGYKEAKVHRLK